MSQQRKAEPGLVPPDGGDPAAPLCGLQPRSVGSRSEQFCMPHNGQGAPPSPSPNYGTKLQLQDDKLHVMPPHLQASSPWGFCDSQSHRPRSQPAGRCGLSVRPSPEGHRSICPGPVCFVKKLVRGDGRFSQEGCSAGAWGRNWAARWARTQLLAKHPIYPGFTRGIPKDVSGFPCIAISPEASQVTLCNSGCGGHCLTGDAGLGQGSAVAWIPHIGWPLPH